jgi:hypothetical protein
LSVIKLLTGLASGEASVQLKLAAGHLASKQSYGNARHDLQLHHGQSIDRTKVRRMALEVEQEAMALSEKGRREALQQVEGEARTRGVPVLLTEGDGGNVRTGELVPCAEGDPHRWHPRSRRHSSPTGGRGGTPIGNTRGTTWTRRSRC